MHFNRLLRGCLILLAMTLSLGARQGSAQKSDPGVTESTEFDPSEWRSLLKKKAELVGQIEKIGETYQAADAAERVAMEQKAETLSKEFQKVVMPRLAVLAPQAFTRDPQDIDAAEVVMQVAYSKNQYPRAAEVADVVLRSKPEHPLALNVSGVSHFAIHDFELANEILQRAQKLGSLYPQLGGQYLNVAGKYVDYWKTEQQIRSQEAAAVGDEQLPQVLLKTSQGDILLELFENEAPNTVANFVFLVERGFYDGIPFHRVVNGFMAQGGRKPPGAGGVTYTIECECHREDARRHFAGTLSMAHAGRNTGGSQFFLTHLPTPHLDREVQPESVHTVFGRVVKGMDAVAALQVDDKILSATVVRKRDHEYKPVTTPAIP